MTTVTSNGGSSKRIRPAQSSARISSAAVVMIRWARPGSRNRPRPGSRWPASPGAKIRRICPPASVAPADAAAIILFYAAADCYDGTSGGALSHHQHPRSARGRSGQAAASHSDRDWLHVAGGGGAILDQIGRESAFARGPGGDADRDFHHPAAVRRLLLSTESSPCCSCTRCAMASFPSCIR